MSAGHQAAPTDVHLFTVRDGRTMAYAEYGDTDGKPAFAFHGFPGSRLTFAFADEAARRHRVRLIAPDRPGMGRSTYKRGRKLVDYPDDVVALADSLGFEKFAVIGLSGGGPYAAACAYKIPERLTGAGIVSGVGPMDRKGGGDGMSRVSRFFLRLHQAFPPLGRLWVWSISIFLKRADAKGVRRSMWLLPLPDRRIIERPGSAEAFAADAREAFRQGARGEAHDYGIYTSKWGFALNAIRTKVHVWHGAADKTVPKEHGQYVAAEIPDAQLHFYPHEGHLLIIDRIGEILDDVVKA